MTSVDLLRTLWLLAQEAVGHLCQEDTVMPHVQFVVHQEPQVLLYRAPFCPVKFLACSGARGYSSTGAGHDTSFHRHYCIITTFCVKLRVTSDVLE